MPNQDHAVVLGASVAGLLAARVLADHFQQVTILERDALPLGTDARRGVPQGAHCHALLASGRRVIEDLFPGLTAEAVAQGAVLGDAARDCRWFLAGGRLASSSSDLIALLASRPFLESLIRQHVLAIANITVRPQSQVEGLTATATRDRVTGVICDGTPLAADLVIDATGRVSRLPLWLEQLGYDAPPDETIEVGLRYTTRSFRRHAADLGGDLATVIPPTPEGKRGGVMLAQEGDRWTVTLVGHFEQHAPEDLAGFLDYARSLPAPYIYETVRDAEPLGPAHSTRFPASRRRRYEYLHRFPEGLLVLGDAVCSFNPVYGQGMSVAALEAEALDAALWIRTPQLARRFFQQISRVIDTPWSIAAGNDLRMPEVVGPRGPLVNGVNWYMERFQRAAQHDAVLAVAFHRVGNLLAPPATLLQPKQLLRVVRASFKPPKVATSPSTPHPKKTHAHSLRLFEEASAPGVARAVAGYHQPSLLPARPADLPPCD